MNFNFGAVWAGRAVGKKSRFKMCKFGMLRININHNMKKSYVMIHVIKHDMDPNSNINYRRKIAP